jgi:hypothetical protein
MRYLHRHLYYYDSLIKENFKKTMTSIFITLVEIYIPMRGPLSFYLTTRCPGHTRAGADSRFLMVEGQLQVFCQHDVVLSG